MYILVSTTFVAETCTKACKQHSSIHGLEVGIKFKVNKCAATMSESEPMTKRSEPGRSRTPLAHGAA